MRKRSGLVVFLFVSSAILLPAAPASASSITVPVRGMVSCKSHRTVVGIWIRSSNGGSGFASFTRLPGRLYAAYYSRSFTVGSTGTAVKLNVGCGSSSSGGWASSNYTANSPPITRTYIFNVVCSDPSSGSGTCKGDPYYAPSSALDHNRFDGGNCTWGAARLWWRATGHYPKWIGNAKDWDNNARALGFSVSNVPEERSIAVWETTSASDLGHVAWVTRAWASGSSIYFHVQEMNFTAPGVWHDRDVKLVAGLSFILAQPGYAITAVYANGDINYDEHIDVKDLSILSTNWDHTVPAWTRGDLNGDGFVDVSICRSCLRTSGRDDSRMSSVDPGLPRPGR